MKRRRLIRTSLAIAAGAAGWAAIASVGSSPAAGTSTASGTPTTVVIDASAGETFSAPTTAPSDVASAADTWAAHAREVGANTQVPTDHVTVEFGRLTLPIGPSGAGGAVVYRAQNQSVWAYHYDACQQSISNDSQAGCSEWVFLEPGTGVLVDDVWQE